MPRKKIDKNQVGVSGLNHSYGRVTEEFIPKLRGRAGRKVYRQMADNDPDIGAFLSIYKAMSLSAPVEVVPAEQDKGLEVVDFVESCMEDMNHSFQDFRSETMEMLVYGFSLFEVVHKRRKGDKTKYPDGKIGWAKFAPRAAETIDRWTFDVDGEISSAIQYDPTTAQEILLPMNRCVLFRTSSSKNNPEGRSILRNAYRPWYHKVQVEDLRGITMERDATGVAQLEMPIELMEENGAKSALRSQMEELVQQLSNGYRHGLVMPAEEEFSPSDGINIKTGWKLSIHPSPGKRMVDFNETVKLLRNQTMSSVAAQFMLLGQGETGSNALAMTQEESLRMSIDYLHSMWCGVMNRQVLPKLMKLNGFMDPAKWPTFSIAPLKRSLSADYLAYIKELTAAGYLVPDENISHSLKKMLMLPVDKV